MDDSNQAKTNNSGASATEIQTHYDVGNEFYKLWLNQSMIYSCALWESDAKDNNLEKAQLRKLLYHIESANAKSKDRVLEIGCGWGGILFQLTQVYNVKRAVGLTLRNVHEITSGFGFRDARLARRKNEGIVGLRRVFATTPGGMNRKPNREVISDTFLSSFLPRVSPQYFLCLVTLVSSYIRKCLFQFQLL